MHKLRDLKATLHKMFILFFFLIFMLGLIIGDLPILIFLIISPFFVKLTEQIYFVSRYIDKIIILLATFCFTMDHYIYCDPNRFEIHVRCYLYLSFSFSFSLLQSDSWLRTSLFFLLCQSLIIIGLSNHFIHVPEEMYAVMVVAWILITNTAYHLENNSR